MILTDRERDYFASYLEAEAVDGRKLLEQMEKLPGIVMKPLLDRERAWIVAASMVASRLRATESQSIDGSKS